MWCTNALQDRFATLLLDWDLSRLRDELAGGGILLLQSAKSQLNESTWTEMKTRRDEGCRIPSKRWESALATEA